MCVWHFAVLSPSVRYEQVMAAISPSSVSFLFLEGDDDESEVVGFRSRLRRAAFWIFACRSLRSACLLQAWKVYERVAYHLQGTHRFLRADANDLKLVKK